MALWFLGYPDRALARIDESLSLAQELAHPYSMAVALNRAAMLGQFRQEIHATRQWAKAAAAIAVAHGFPRHAAIGPLFRGWTLAMQGQGVEGITQIRQGLVAYRDLGMAMEDPYFLALLAAAYVSAGQVQDGKAALDDALTRLPGERGFFYEAELYRLQGEWCLHSSGSDVQRAEGYFYRALAIARRQGAKSLELRAAISLSRLWQQQRKFQEAHTLLADIFAWFTEGFDTPDLQEAKRLLQTCLKR